MQALIGTGSMKHLLPYQPNLVVEIPEHARNGPGGVIVVSCAHLDFLVDQDASSGLTKEKLGALLRATLQRYNNKWPAARVAMLLGDRSMTASQALSEKGRLPFLVDFIRDILIRGELPPAEAPAPVAGVIAAPVEGHVAAAVGGGLGAEEAGMEVEGGQE